MDSIGGFSALQKYLSTAAERYLFPALQEAGTLNTKESIDASTAPTEKPMIRFEKTETADTSSETVHTQWGPLGVEELPLTGGVSGTPAEGDADSTPIQLETQSFLLQTPLSTIEETIEGTLEDTVILKELDGGDDSHMLPMLPMGQVHTTLSHPVFTLDLPSNLALSGTPPLPSPATVSERHMRRERFEFARRAWSDRPPTPPPWTVHKVSTAHTEARKKLRGGLFPSVSNRHRYNRRTAPLLQWRAGY